MWKTNHLQLNCEKKLTFYILTWLSEKLLLVEMSAFLMSLAPNFVFHSSATANTHTVSMETNLVIQLKWTSAHVLYQALN